ncbi:MAG: ABC transporter permease [Bacteroidales bacterium]|nr:ABC transporter permease [Bacteroidales bacterium]
MNLELFIAKRYAAAFRKRRNIINVISLISVIAIAGATMALVVMLSVFNGMEGLVISMLNTFDTSLKIEPVEGKHFPTDSTTIARLENLPGVVQVVEVIEENALAEYNGRQHIVRVKGVSSNYQTFSSIDSLTMDGKFLLEEGDLNYAVMGSGVWYLLGVNIRDFLTQLTLIAPRRMSGNTMNVNSFNHEYIIPGGVFSIQQELDEKYIFVPLRFAQSLFEYDSLRSFYEVWTLTDADAAKIKPQVMSIMGADFRVLDRYEQQKTIYKVMKSEKWAGFLILTFIILISAFNTISSIAMLIMDKQKDMYILNAMGNPVSRTRRIFLWQGLLQSAMGAAIGIVIGLIICLLQNIFGFIPLDAENGSFAVNYYPVIVQWTDIVLVFLTIMLIGLITACIPVLGIKRQGGVTE